MQLSHTIKMLVKEIEIICKNLKFEERKGRGGGSEREVNTSS